MTATLEPPLKALVDVTACLDALLQVAGLDEASNGLIVGGRPTVAKAGLAVNASFQAIDAAIQRQCDLLITHHPASPATDAHLAGAKLARLREAGLNFYVAHGCLDTAREFGTADALARAVQVALQGTFKPDGEREFGVHGITLGNLAEFTVRVGNRLGVEPRTHKNNDGFGHVALIPGSGARPEWMGQALALGCDTLLTGEAGLFGLLFAREAGLNLVVAGHYATETPGMLALSARIARDLQLDVTFIPETIVEG
jgi:putative NIF3 family GTP cyclohydrolase 1 type 2